MAEMDGGGSAEKPASLHDPLACLHATNEGAPLTCGAPSFELSPDDVVTDTEIALDLYERCVVREDGRVTREEVTKAVERIARQREVWVDMWGHPQGFKEHLHTIMSKLTKGLNESSTVDKSTLFRVGVRQSNGLYVCHPSHAPAVVRTRLGCSYPRHDLCCL